jgi:hypothetical protein
MLMLPGLSMLIINNMANKLVPVISLELLHQPVVVVEDQPHPLLLLLKAVLVLLKVELMLKPFNKVLTGFVVKLTVNQSTLEVLILNQTPSMLMLLGLSMLTINKMANKLVPVTFLALPLLFVVLLPVEILVEDADVLLRMELTLVVSKVLSIGSVVKLTVNQSTLEVLTSNQTHSKHMHHGLLTLITPATALLVHVTLLALLLCLVQTTVKMAPQLLLVDLVEEQLQELSLVLLLESSLLLPLLVLLPIPTLTNHLMVLLRESKFSSVHILLSRF